MRNVDTTMTSRSKKESANGVTQSVGSADVDFTYQELLSCPSDRQPFRSGLLP